MPASNKHKSRLRCGSIVEVRSWPEILRTLDDQGMLDALPFMPEMVQYCGRRFRVLRPIERTCTEGEEGFGRIADVVFLDELRCDGSSHGGCQKSCLLFWKTAWLKDVEGEPPEIIEPRGDPLSQFPFPSNRADGEYICQSTELTRATRPLSWRDLPSWLRSLSAAYSLRQFTGIVARKCYLKFRHWVTGQAYGFVQGTNRRTPVEVLSLTPGEWVRVKSKEEIAATLDRNGKNQGLVFTAQMIPFCGGTFRVRQRLDRMINERTQRLIQVQNTVTLDGVVCEGGHVLRGGCPRANFYYWREAWLRRYEPPR